MAPHLAAAGVVVAAGAAGAGAAVAAANTVAGAAVQAATGSILNKLEVVINFFQVYGLVLNLDIDIEWPNIWMDFSELCVLVVRKVVVGAAVLTDVALCRYNWIPNIFSIDIDNIFTSIDVTIPTGIYDLVRFFSIMAIPLVCFILYFLFKSASLDAWIKGYIHSWNFRRNRAIALYVLLLIMSAVGWVFFDHPTSLDKVKSGSLPDPVVNTLIAMTWGVLTAMFLMWLGIVSLFRWKYVLLFRAACPVGRATPYSAIPCVCQVLQGAEEG